MKRKPLYRCITKATKKENGNPQYSANWIFARRAIFRVFDDCVQCGNWNIAYSDITAAICYKTKQFYIPVNVLELKTENEVFQFGFNPWANPFAFLKIDYKTEQVTLKMSPFSALLRLMLFFAIFIRLLFAFGRVTPSRITFFREVPGSYALHMDEQLFYRQTRNNCAPYSVMAAVNIVRGEEKDGEELARHTKWRIFKNLTLPQGVVKQLEENGVKTKEYVLRTQSDRAKKQWIQQMIARDEPIICLIKVNHVQHYVTVLGYNEDGVMLYDSMQEKASDTENPRKTIIDARCTEGNRFYSYDTFLQLWNDGGYKVFFKNWAVVCK